MAKKTKPRETERWTETRVFSMLAVPFPDGAYVRLPQVRNGTGFRSRTRTADALIVSCWPSRGLWFAGVEIKVSLHDWKRELATPDKSAEIQKWCDYWYMAAPAGVVPLGELPPTWGLIECTAKGCKIAKPAPKLKPKAIDVAFVAAILRNLAETTVPKIQVEELAAKRAEELASRDRYEVERLRERIESFRKETGIDVHGVWEYGAINEAIKLVQRSKVKGVKALAEYMKREATRLVQAGCEVMAICDQVLSDPEAKKNLGPDIDDES